MLTSAVIQHHNGKALIVTCINWQKVPVFQEKDSPNVQVN